MSYTMATSRINEFRFPNVIDDDFVDNVRQALEIHKASNIKLENLNNLDYILNNSNPSDYILMTKESVNTLINFWSKIKNSESYDKDKAPSDLLISQNIPLKDVVFRMDVYDDEYSKKTSEFYVRFIVINSTLTIVVKNSNGALGVVKTTLTEDELFVDETIVYVDNDNLALCNQSSKRAEMYKSALKIITINTAGFMLQKWYSLQIMLLNPDVKKRFCKQYGKEKIRTKDSAITGNDPSTRKRKAKYVKWQIIDISSTEEHQILDRQRHTLCWYVIGHYRHYKDGSKTFVHGYWKGPLREAKKNLDGGRERIV